MIALDTNILVYAHRADSPFHKVARGCVAHLGQAMATWAIPWPCIYEFLVVVTHPRIYAPPTPLAGALDQVDAWLESPTLVLLSEAPTHWSTMKEFLLTGQVIGPPIHDGKIAALCQQHGVREFWTADRDFGRFPMLTVVNPLLPRRVN